MSEEQDKSPDWKGYGIDQAFVEQWVRATFGDKVMDDPEERGARVVEEAIELLQVLAHDKKAAREKAHKLVDAVFDKPVGDLDNEIGGTIVCLLALCGNQGKRLDEMAEKEITRIRNLPVETFRAKHKTKIAAGLSIPGK